MRNLTRNNVRRSVDGQNGFTLIELLIVVGIIVALAAVIIPLVIQFSDKGQEGSRAAEAEGVQTAIDVMMTDDRSQGFKTFTSDLASATVCLRTLMTERYLNALMA